MAVFNFSCFATQAKQDPETGCYHGGCTERSDYEACRQSFYLKQQNEILRQNQNQTKAAPTPTPSVIVPQSEGIDPGVSTQLPDESFYLLGVALIAGVLIGFLLKSLLSKRK